MKNIYLAVLVLLIIGSLLVVTNLEITKKSDTTINQQNSSSDSNSNTQTNENVDLRYIKDYQTSLSIEDGKKVLFFYASWCPTCIPADKEFSQKENQIPEDVVVIRVNYNDTDTDQEEKDLAKKYGVTYQHTFVQIDESGKAITKWNGGSLSELVKNIK